MIWSFVLSRADGIVPFRARIMMRQPQPFHFIIRHLPTLRILLLGHRRVNPQAAPVFRPSDQSHHQAKRPQWHSRPIPTDRTKQAVLHRITLRRSCRIMTDCDLQPELIAHGSNPLELRVAVGVGRTGERLAIAEEGDPVFFSSRRSVFFESTWPRAAIASRSLSKLRPAQTSRRFGSPALCASTISRRAASICGFCSSTFLRPWLPARILPGGGEGSSPRSSLRPREMVSSQREVMRASWACPPCSRQSESSPVIWRVKRSSQRERICRSMDCQRGSLSHGAPLGSRGT